MGWREGGVENGDWWTVCTCYKRPIDVGRTVYPENIVESISRRTWNQHRNGYGHVEFGSKPGCWALGLDSGIQRRYEVRCNWNQNLEEEVSSMRFLGNQIAKRP